VACLPLDITPPRRIRKAVIPAAGFGTRMFPASKAVKKELAPLVDRDGLAKPVIQVVVEEAVRSGVEEVAIVVQPDDRAIFEAFFKAPLSPQHLHSLPTALREHAAALRRLGRRVSFLEQDRQEGFGHAVLCAREWVADEPFLLMLGDHVYRTDTDTPCAAQVISAYEAAGGHVVGLARTPPEEVSGFGAAAGTWVERDHLLAVAEFAEKPSLDYAEANLRVEGIEDGFLTLFGLYALGPAIFEHLQHLCDHNLRQGGEFQLTDALALLRKHEQCFGCVVRGRRFDTGRPAHYLKTLAAFSPPPEGKTSPWPPTPAPASPKADR